MKAEIERRKRKEEGRKGKRAGLSRLGAASQHVCAADLGIGLRGVHQTGGVHLHGSHVDGGTAGGHGHLDSISSAV